MVLLCAMVALLSLPATAGAKPGYKVRPGSFFLQVPLPGKDGWELILTAVDHRQIYLTASRGAASVQYRVAGRASSRLVKADFGSLGRVDIRLDLDETRPLYPPFLMKLLGRDNCRGKEPVGLLGRFHGVVDFAGEEKVAGVFTRRGGAVVERIFRNVCKQRPEKPGKKRKKRKPRVELEANLFAARAHSGGRTTFFEAFGIGVESEVLFGLFSSKVHERLGRVRIIRSAFELAESPMLEFSRKGREPVIAKVKPPKPFTSSATYRKRTGSRATWSGDLSIRLPGAGEVPLAGPEFKTTLCQIEISGGIEDLDPCLSRIKTLSSSSRGAEMLRGGHDAWRVLGVTAPISRHSLSLALRR